MSSARPAPMSPSTPSRGVTRGTLFDDGLAAEIQVNPEFGNAYAALLEAQKYGFIIGQLPTALHRGRHPFGVFSPSDNRSAEANDSADQHQSDRLLRQPAPGHVPVRGAGHCRQAELVGRDQELVWAPRALSRFDELAEFVDHEHK